MFEKNTAWVFQPCGVFLWMVEEFSVIRVYPAQDEVHAKVGDDDAEEGEDAVDVEKQRLLERFPKFLVQRGGIDEQSD